MAEEKEVFGGVYFTDFRKQSTSVVASRSSSGVGGESGSGGYQIPPGFEGNSELLRIEIDRLENSIKHLVSSNEYIVEALKEELDEELISALDENAVVIEKQKKQIVVLTAALERCSHP